MDEQEKALLKIEKLFALAGSDNENEASNAALAAVRLIKKHGLKVVAEGAAPRSVPPFDDIFGFGDVFFDSLRRAAQQKAREDIERMKRQAAEAAATQQSAAQSARRSAASAPGARRPTSAGPMPDFNTPTSPPEYHRTKSKYSSFCRACRGRIQIGEEIFWKPGVGCWHLRCVDGDKVNGSL